MSPDELVARVRKGTVVRSASLLDGRWVRVDGDTVRVGGRGWQSETQLLDLDEVVRVAWPEDAQEILIAVTRARHLRAYHFREGALVQAVSDY